MLKTFTVDMAEMARLMMVAENPVISRSVGKRGLARGWETQGEGLNELLRT